MFALYEDMTCQDVIDSRDVTQMSRSYYSQNLMYTYCFVVLNNCV